MNPTVTNAPALTNAQATANFAGVFVVSLFFLALSLYTFVAMWKTFRKAGHPGWAAIVPFYNYYVMAKIAGRPGWWFILYCIPLVNFVIGIIVAVGIANKFGKGALFGIFGLLVFPYIGYPILGFGSAVYEGGDLYPPASGAIPGIDQPTI